MDRPDPEADAGDTAGPVLARLDRPRVADPVEVAVIADPHLAVDRRGNWKVFHRTEDRLRTAVSAAAGADHVHFLGDLTGEGTPAEFDRFEELVAGLEGWSAVPGNHDVPKAGDDHESPSAEAFAARYAPGGDYPFVREVGGLRLVGLNSASLPDGSLRETWGGGVSAAQRERLPDLLAGDVPTVVLVHHNLGPLPEHPGGSPWTEFQVREPASLVELLRAAGADLVVSGHHHVPAVADRGGLVELLAPAACSFPQASLSLRVGPRGTAVRFRPLAGPAGHREAYWHARHGRPVATGVLELASARLGRFPLLDQGSDREVPRTG